MQDPNFTLVWGAYLGASVILSALIWWQVRKLFPCWLKAIFISWGVALLFTPAFGNEAGEYWVPAIMAALFKGIQQASVDGSMVYVKNIGVAWAVLAAVWMIVCILKRRRQ
ncbi:MAG: hypothetical protein HOM11_01140 [Methylococcales bacterium]|jgi:hypothetical protein|nr:hypothetical protein [Methylococcales bacterium]MBT7444078.1 hypothetical protein [Methylococcales bacterium]